MITRSQIEVRYAETDKMGVVHHSHYPVYFEQGRTEYFKEHLLPYQEFEARGVMAPIISYSVTLRGKLTYGDHLCLDTFPKKFKGLTVVMGYRGFNNQTLIVEGESVHAITDLHLEPLHPRHFPELYDVLRKGLS